MLDSPVFWIGFLVLLPTFFAIGRLFAKVLILPFINDRVQIRLVEEDGSIISRRVKLSKEDDLIDLLDSVAHNAKRQRKAPH